MSALHHFVGGEGLLRLIIIIQMPGQIGDREKEKRQSKQAPSRNPRIQKTSHRELIPARTRWLPQAPLFAGTRSAGDADTRPPGIQSRQRTARTGPASPPLI